MANADKKTLEQVGLIIGLYILITVVFTQIFNLIAECYRNINQRSKTRN